MSDVPNGRFCWFELMTVDRKGAADFYTQVAGWKTEEWPGMDPPYAMWMNGETGVGGLMDLPPEALAAGAPPHWIAYVSTHSVDDTVAKAVELGGSVVWGPMQVPEVGRFAGLTDPQGAHFAILQPETDAPGHDNLTAPGEFSWYELATTDWEAAWSFYTALFDWAEDSQMDMGPMGTYHMFNRGAHPLGGLYNKPPEIPMPHWLLYVHVADIEAAAAKVAELGGQVLNGPMQVPGDSGDAIAQCMDPHGAAFALHGKAAG